MAKTRALMTETERNRIARREDVEDIKRYQAISRVRRRIGDELVEDVAILREHHEDLLEELRDVVCEQPPVGDDHAEAAGDEPAAHLTERGFEEGAPEEREQAAGERVEAETVSEEAEEGAPSAGGESGESDAQKAEEIVREFDLPGSGEVYEARVETILDLYAHLQEEAGEIVPTSDLKALVDETAVGYSGVESFWSNFLKKNQNHPNVLTVLPGVQELGNGRYTYRPGDE